METPPPRRRFAESFALQPLEPRTLLSAGAASVDNDASAPAPAGVTELAVAAPVEAIVAPAQLLTKAVRQNLLNHWTGPNKASLQEKLSAGRLGAFDAAMLEYVRTRPGQSFIWQQQDVDDIVEFINDELDTRSTIERGDDLVAHRFPEQAHSGSYDVQLPPGDINWSTQTSNPEFVQSLNRHEFWLDLAQSHRFTGQAKYVNELMAQLASWSQQHPALADPNDWPAAAPRWNLLDTSVRAQTWVWTYQMVVGSGRWTPEANTLMLVKLLEQGDFLRRVTPFALNSNRALVHGHGLLQIAQLMPEFAGASEWEAYARNLIFGAMDTQLYPDGGHVEQSPNYAVNAINDLLEAFWLDRLKGDESKWPAERVQRLTNAMEAHVQLLSPNGAMAALSDTYRVTSVHMLTKAREILETQRWPAALPRIRDVWLFGPDAMEPFLDAPVTPTLGDRGDSFGMPDSGYFVMRSGNGSGSRQLTFDAGPTGGIHGHFDLLNFELFGYGKPLIADPGLYKYDDSDHRAYVVSTRAHNTINVEGDNHLALENPGNANIVVDQWSNDADHAQVAAHHFGYAHVAGQPVVGRSIWYDYDDVALIVDWGQSTLARTYQVSFNLPGTASTVSGVEADGSFRTRYSSGNVKVAPLLRAGQVAARNAPTFVSNFAPPNESNPAYRFTITGSGTFQVFATLVTTYSGTTPPNVKAEWVTTSPQPGQPIVLRLTKDGESRDITFAPPIARPPRNLASPTGAANDLAFDAAGNVHLAYFDRLTRNLKYTVRNRDGVWSAVRTIDPDLNAGVFVSLALDAAGTPGVAYYDGHRGDLRFAKRQPDAGWDVRTVDTAGEAGLYPSLVFSGTNDPIISYYQRTAGDLRIATTVGNGWSITAVDTAGDVGRSSSLQLDPNFPAASNVVIAYSDTTRGTYKYAVQFGSGWKTLTIDSQTTMAGGYTSLQFSPVPAADGTYRPTVSYYDAGNGALKFATFDGAAWHPQTIVSDGNVGLYTAHVYDAANRANVFFFNKTTNRAYRATLVGGAWDFTFLGVGGREMNVTRHAKGALAYTTLDDSAPLLEVGILGS